jgi:hypothetical protein
MRDAVPVPSEARVGIPQSQSRHPKDDRERGVSHGSRRS